MLRILPILILSFLFQTSLHSQKLNEDLIGEWKFYKLEDPAGNKIDTLQKFDAYEIATAPYTIFNSDGTYTKQFTSVNQDAGTWTYKKRKKEIHLKLVYKKPYGVAAKFLIDKGHAKKDKNGDYYEIVTEKVIRLDSEFLAVEQRGNILTYIKVK